MLDFLSVASEIIRDDPGLVPCQPAIEKELLHFEILSAMHGAGHLRHLMFIGDPAYRQHLASTVNRLCRSVLGSIHANRPRGHGLPPVPS